MPATEQATVVAVFEDGQAARRAADEVRGAGFTDGQVGVVLPASGRPGSTPMHTESGAAVDRPAVVAGQLGQPAPGETLLDALLRSGVPAGPARFYEQEFQAGRGLVLVRAEGGAAQVQRLLRGLGGYDLETRGAALVRGQEGPSDDRARPVPPAAFVSQRWEDVVDRYEMLFDQHFGTTDATWDQYQPVYRFAWTMANDRAYYGRAWPEAEPEVRRAWESGRPAQPWDHVRGAIQDVWQDVADEAGTPQEGGEYRYVEKPLDLQPPAQRLPLTASDEKALHEAADPNVDPDEGTHQIGTP